MPSKDGTSNLHPSAITCDSFQKCSLLFWVTLQTVGQKKSGGKRYAGAGVKLRRRRALGSGKYNSSPSAKKKPNSTCKPPDCISSSNPPGNNNSCLQYPNNGDDLPTYSNLLCFFCSFISLPRLIPLNSLPPGLNYKRKDLSRYDTCSILTLQI